MQTLDEQETTAVFEKLFKFVGNNLKYIIDAPSHECLSFEPPGRYCFWLQKNRVYFVDESLVKRATKIPRDKIVALGTQIRKFTHGGNFHLTIQFFPVLATNAKHKVWVKSSAEIRFLYGNHVLKGGVGRMLEWIEAGDGVVQFSMADMALGFGIAGKGKTECRKLDPNGIVVLHKSDIGEYLRTEDEL